MSKRAGGWMDGRWMSKWIWVCMHAWKRASKWTNMRTHLYAFNSICSLPVCACAYEPLFALFYKCFFFSVRWYKIESWSANQFLAISNQYALCQFTMCLSAYVLLCISNFAFLFVNLLYVCHIMILLLLLIGFFIGYDVDVDDDDDDNVFLLSSVCCFIGWESRTDRYMYNIYLFYFIYQIDFRFLWLLSPKYSVMGMQARTKYWYVCVCIRACVCELCVICFFFLFLVLELGTIGLHLTIFIAYCINRRDNNEKKTDTHT